MGVLEKLQDDVSDLRETKGNHEAQLKTLTTQIEGLTTAVTTLTATLNQGRGALWAICMAAGAAGAVVTAVIEWVRH